MGKIESSKSGQAVLEYILLLAIVVMIFSAFIKQLSERDWFDRLSYPITHQFKYAYQYGHPDARGVEDGGQKNIAQHPESFRIFLNPTIER